MCAENSVGREGGADQRDACQAGQVGEAVNQLTLVTLGCGKQPVGREGDLSMHG